MITNTRTLPERLHDNRLLQHCTLRDRKIIARHLEVLDLPAGTSVARAGDTATNFYLVLDGELTATTRLGVRTVATNDFTGELGLLQRSTNNEDITAERDCQIGVLGARMFHVLLRDLPPFSHALMADLARRASTTTAAFIHG